MSIKNVNAIADIEAISKDNKIITINNGSFYKIIPYEQNQKMIKIYLSFYASIINGTDNFFAKNKKLYFQLRITDQDANTYSSFVLNEFEIDIENSIIQHHNKYVDFIADNRSYVLDLNLEGLNLNSSHFLTVLVKTENDMINGKGWTVQSISPIGFKSK